MSCLASDSALQKVFDDNLNPNKAQAFLKTKDPKMSTINRFLENKNVQDEFFKLKSYPPDIRLPIFKTSDNIIFGTVSDVVHHPALSFIILNSDMNKEFKDFYTGMADYYEYKVVEFDDQDAFTGSQYPGAI